jgi:hypothetical protein
MDIKRSARLVFSRLHIRSCDFRPVNQMNEVRRLYKAAVLLIQQNNLLSAEQIEERRERTQQSEDDQNERCSKNACKADLFVFP